MLKIRKLLTISVYIALGICVVVLMVSCTAPNTLGTPTPRVISTEKYNKNGVRVIHTLWNEQGVDPRCAIGYRLNDENRTGYFDHVVQLYALRLRDRDCSQDPNVPHCNRNGLHLCWSSKLIYDRTIGNYDTVVKPVREAGIKFILSIVPEGDGVCVGTLYRWPMEQWWSWEKHYGEEYPYGPEAVQGLIQQLKELFAQYPFDGIGYDEEYGIKKEVGDQGRGGVYPENKSYSGIDIAAAGKIGGENMLRFMHEVNEAFGRDLIHESYEIRYGATIPESYTYDGKTIKRDDLLDYSYNSHYGGYASTSGNGMPREKYGPAAVDIGFADTPRPSSVETITGNFDSHLRRNYGVVMYYCMRSRAGLKAKYPNYFGTDNAPLETYLSRISNILHGYDTIYIGDDYPGDS